MASPDRQIVEDKIRLHLERGETDRAATEAVRGLGREILGYLRAILRDEDLAAEAFAEFSENLWKGIGSYRADGSFAAWAYGVAWGVIRRFAGDAYRKRRRRLYTTEISKIAEQVRVSTAMHLKSTVKDGIAKLRASLTPDEHSLLILRVDRDLSWSEVARVFAEEGRPTEEGALRKRFERIKAKLKKLAESEGLLRRD